MDEAKKRNGASKAGTLMADLHSISLEESKYKLCKVSHLAEEGHRNRKRKRERMKMVRSAGRTSQMMSEVLAVLTQR